ncbi:MAG TPA: PEP-CTERM sorting domain-containing protein [Rhodanobacteraceae bacterium]
MLKKKSIGIALAGALALVASGAAFAAPVNVGGVVFNPDQTFNPIFQATNFRETSVTTAGQTLLGYGMITNLNNEYPTQFCPGCDLTFTFSYTVKDVNGQQVVFDGGALNFYVVQNFNVNDPSSAMGTTPWLTLTGHTYPFIGYSTDGTLYSTVTGPVGAPTTASGFGLLDVSGGMAGKFFDTNSQTDGSDFLLNSSFQLATGNDICTGAGGTGTCYPIAGQGGLTGLATTPVPEPGEMGLLGLGLAILGFFIQRRRKEADGRA